MSPSPNARKVVAVTPSALRPTAVSRRSTRSFSSTAAFLLKASSRIRFEATKPRSIA
jgi:hypothetical protein